MLNVDQLAAAAELDEHIRSLAARPASARRNTVVIAGAGFTGIETAAEMPARLRQALGDDSPVHIIMVERNADVGPDLGPGPRPVITQALTELGISWKLGSGWPAWMRMASRWRTENASRRTRSSGLPAPVQTA